jgi:hypothetical protein
MILSTRNFAASRATCWALVLLAITGLPSACSSSATDDGPSALDDGLRDTIVVTPAPPTVSLEEQETPLIGPTIESQEIESAQTNEPAATGTNYPPATIAIEAKATQTNASATNPVIEIPLAGPVANPDAELSGLAWYGDYLIMLPQYPDFDTDEADGFIYALPKADITSFLVGEISRPLEPRQVPFVAPGLNDTIAGFEGYEAITFLGDDVYVAIESEVGDGMLGYLAKGAMAPDLSTLTLDTSKLVTVAPQSDIENMSEESVFATEQVVGTIYELNGRGVNASPIVHLFDLDLTPIEPIGFLNLEFRITDVSELDHNDRFWAINYFFPGTGEYSETPVPQEGSDDSDRTQPPWEGLGRLVEFQYAPSGITLTGAPPIQLESLLSDIHNWEGLARLDDRGFLIVSDEIPDTSLGFVPFPDAE